MAPQQLIESEELVPLNRERKSSSWRSSRDSISSASTTSLVFDRIQDKKDGKIISESERKTSNDDYHAFRDEIEAEDKEFEFDIEDGSSLPLANRPMGKETRRLFWIWCGIFTSVWIFGLVVFLSRKAYRHSSSIPHDPLATASRGSGKEITLDQVMGGMWRAKTHSISWIEGANGEDGLLLEKGGSEPEKDWLVVEDIRKQSEETAAQAHDSISLMKKAVFSFGGETIMAEEVWPSKDLKHVLVMSEKKNNWRHSYTGTYWIFDVASQEAQPLDPGNEDGRIQLASWSPKSDAIVYTRDNNMFLRNLDSKSVRQITKDGGTELFYGVPDWVYEEEVFQTNTATWWAEDGQYVAFLRTNESAVPEYPIQYFISRPSGEKPAPGEANYPEVREIKYPKAGAPNPKVALLFYDVRKNEVFSVQVEGDPEDSDRLITEVVWAGSTGKVLIRETNRESDVLRVILVDVKLRTGKIVREIDVTAIDGGWFEVSQETKYIPADPSNGRPEDGYIDTIIHNGYDHLAYFTPMDNGEPLLLTSGNWEVVKAPSAVDLTNNLVYFFSTYQSSIERHLFSVTLNGSSMVGITDHLHEGYYSATFSKGTGYTLLSYEGPDVPWQEVVNTPSNPLLYKHEVEVNDNLKQMAAKHELPIELYTNVTIDGYTLNVVERRPPHFNRQKAYPVLFHLYGGPGSQTVNKKWNVDFQAFVAANLGYIVVTVDGRGTGFIGRKSRCTVRGDLGYYEARDQIETAKIWAKKKYVDESRIAIWGWSYGGFLTLKTLEQDAGETFQYGMAVAPVTDWRFYDSIYTERYMHTPQHNPSGYNNSSISDVKSLQKNTRFLIMHGVADDNVHMQNTLTLIDKLDLASVENYDVHFFPDSDHSIYFHNANRMVFDRLKDWLINAFNGEWARTEDPVPIGKVGYGND